MPYQKNWVPSVAMKDGMPTLAMMHAVDETDQHAGAERRDHRQPAEVVFLEQDGEDEAGKADDRPESDRSISPAPMTKVRPMASRISGGRVDRKVV